MSARDRRELDRPVPVSVVVVTHNSRRHVPACIEGLNAGAAGVGFELIVVDNGSSDETADMVEQVAPAARVLRGDNVGFAAAVNQACARARGEAVLLLNPDATMQPGSLRRLVAELDGAPGELAAVGPQLLDSDGSNQISARPLPSLRAIAFQALMAYHLWPRSRWYRSDQRTEASSTVDCLSGACLLIRRRVLHAVGGLDEDFFLYGEDLDLFVRLHARGYRCRFVPAARVLHEVGGSSFQDRRAFFVNLHRSQAILIRKHLWGVRRHAAALAQLVGVGLRALAYSACAGAGRRGDFASRAGHHVAVLKMLLAGRHGGGAGFPAVRSCVRVRESRAGSGAPRPIRLPALAPIAHDRPTSGPKRSRANA